MGAYYKDENMEDRLIVMGCYGIGVTRTLAAVVEQHHDEDGIIWPVSVAPYHAMIVLVNGRDAEQTALAESLYAELTNAGVEVSRRRAEQPGVKFKDADLLGFPVRITVGKKRRTVSWVEAPAEKILWVERRRRDCARSNS